MRDNYYVICSASGRTFLDNFFQTTSEWENAKDFDTKEEAQRVLDGPAGIPFKSRSWKVAIIHVTVEIDLDI